MSVREIPKITFGIIVLNGEPFTKYCLRSLYPFAHQIVVVEGACPGAASSASPEGHSTDGTLEALKRFQQEEDFDHKVQVLTRDGFWSEKDEQSRAYAQQATGDYLWQVDIDEFYKPEDMRSVLHMLHEDPEITSVSFEQITFWGGFDYFTDSWYLRAGASTYHRLFKWREGYQYVTHRPPTVTDAAGRDLRSGKWVQSKELVEKGIYLYHYSLVFPQQAFEKSAYHSNRTPSQFSQALEWTKNVYEKLENPYRVHNVYSHPSWLERFKGTHPPQINALREDIRSGRVKTLTRPTQDIEQVIDLWRYRFGRFALKVAFPFAHFLEPIWKRATYVISHPLRTAAGLKRRALRLLQSSS